MNLPIGSIILWFTGTIPSGWQLCDGSNGTPDLRGYFIKGANNSGDLLDSGGVSSHTHTNPNTGSESSHNHAVSGTTSGPSGSARTAVGGSSYPTTSTHTHTFSGNTSSAGSHSHTLGITGSQSNLPPYIKLYYIMRIA